jgi:GH35 family endo-1,4-beta-xylanase
MKRRNFIRNAALFGTGTYLNACAPTPIKVVAGEEWSKATVNQTASVSEADQEVMRKAKENIEKYRKTKVIIDISQLSLPENTPLSIKQIRSDFDFGCAYGEKYSEVQNSDVLQRRSEKFAALFNCTTAKCYWDERWHQPIEKIKGVRNYSVFVDEIKWAKHYGIKCKGHPLVWTVPKAVPQWFHSLTPKEQEKHLREHIESLLKIGGEDVPLWDLCNEMLWETTFTNLSQRKWPHIEPIENILTYLEPATHWARAAQPNAIFSLNEYGLEMDYTKGVTAQQQRERYVKLVLEMKKRGCAPDAIGTQAHVGRWFTPSEFQHSLDELAKAEIPIQITEFWAELDANPNKNLSQIENEAQLVQYVENCYTIAFGHPKVNHFTYWGRFFENTPERQDIPKRLYFVLDKLINQTWKTKIDTVVKDTKIEANCFMGSYQMTAQRGNTTDTFSFEVNKDTKIVMVN